MKNNITSQLLNDDDKKQLSLHLKKINNNQIYNYNHTINNSTTNNYNLKPKGIFNQIISILLLPLKLITFLTKKFLKKDIKTIYSNYKTNYKIKNRESKFYKKIQKYYDSDNEIF